MENRKLKCLICGDIYPQKGVSFFKLPKEESRLKVWVKGLSPILNVLKIPLSTLSENGRICARHFNDSDFVNSKKNSLVQNACPHLDILKEDNDMTKPKTSQKDEHGIEKDTFQCGRCKSQFQLLSDFMDHKRFYCKITKTSSSENKLEKTLTQEQVAFSLGEDLINNLDNKLVNSLPLKNEEPNIDSTEENKIVSIVMNENGLIFSSPVDFSNFGGQVVLAPQTPICFNDIFTGNPVDVSSLAGQVIVAPSNEEKPVLVNNTKEDETVEGLILTDSINNSNEIIYAYASGLINGSSENSSQISNEKSPPQLIFSTDVINKLEGNLSETYGEGNDSLSASHLSINASNFFGFDNISTESVLKPSKVIENGDFKNKTKLPCSFCGKIFDKPFNLQQHERIHTGERPFQCIICGRAFSQKSNVRKHMIRHKVWPHAKKTLRITVNQNQKEQGMLDQNIYSCQYCSLSFKSYSLHKKHLAVHSNYKVYRCIQKGCDETFSDLDEFLTHSKMHSSAEFQCHICLKPFTSLGDLGAHQYDHDPSGRDRKEIDVKLKCEVCHAQFKTVESLKNHKAVDSHRYECLHCKSVFSSERFLRRHLITHLDPSQSKFECPNCKKSFRTQKNLNNHIFVHLKEKPFNCEHCGKQFAAKYRLQRHLAIHLNQYFECPFKAHLGCDKTFYRKDKLRDHINTHSHCRLRSCQVCSKTYWSLSKLNQHMKREHKTGRGKQVLKCVNCSQTFRKQKQLTQHHCTVGQKKFRSRIRNSSGDKIRNLEGVSNIEIIMVPFVSDCRNVRTEETLT